MLIFSILAFLRDAENAKHPEARKKLTALLRLKKEKLSEVAADMGVSPQAIMKWRKAWIAGKISPSMVVKD